MRRALACTGLALAVAALLGALFVVGCGKLTGKLTGVEHAKIVKELLA